MVSSQIMLVLAKPPLHQTRWRSPMLVSSARCSPTSATGETAEMMWADFSAWLLFAGWVVGALAVIAALVDLFTRRLSRAGRPVWPYLLDSLVVLVLSFLCAGA